MSKQEPILSTHHFWHPRYGLTWIGLFILRIIILLPWCLQRQIARFLGWLIYHLAKRRRLIAKTNIDLCFPDWDPQQRATLLRQTLYENALGFLETGHAFWAPEKRLKNICHFYGLESLQAALQRGRGVILVGAHYSTLDLGGRLFTQFCPVDILYRPHKNKLFDHILLQSRLRWADQVFDNKTLRAVIKSLQKNHVFWYPADQDYGPQHAIFAPFFQQQAATLNTTARLSTLTGAAVFVLGHHRRNTDFEYDIHVAEVTPIPQDDWELTARINQMLEHEIRRYPAQYMWVHRRFKTRPDGEPYLYPC